MRDISLTIIMVVTAPPLALRGTFDVHTKKQRKVFRSMTQPIHFLPIRALSNMIHQAHNKTFTLRATDTNKYGVQEIILLRRQFLPKRWSCCRSPTRFRLIGNGALIKIALITHPVSNIIILGRAPWLCLSNCRGTFWRGCR